MKKYFLTFGLLGTLTFLCLVFYFYKTTGKFRQSIITAFAAMTFYFSALSPAHSAGQADAAFTQQNQQHQSRPQTQGIFSRKSNNDGSGSGKPDGDGSDGGDDGIPKYPKTESIEETQRHLSNIDEQIHKLEEVTDSDSETEKDQCPIKPTGKFEVDFEFELDKNGNPIIRVDTKTGSEVLVTYDKALEKYYHQDVYNLETPKNFDSKEARSLKPKDRIEYLKKTVPRDKVIEFQIANAKSLSTENLLPVPGFIGAQKEPGTLYINKETGQVHFVNARTNTWRTTVIKTRTGLINLAKNNFHLFPNAGK